MIAFKTDKSKEISCLLETYLKMHATQNQKLCSGKTLDAVMAPPDKKESIYTPLICRSVIPLKGNHTHRGLIMTPSDQEKCVYTELCRPVIPSSGNPMHNESVVTPTDVSEAEYALPSSVTSSIENLIAQSSHSRNEGIVTYGGTVSAPVNGRYKSQTKSINGSSLTTLQERCISSSDQTTPMIQLTPSEQDAREVICYNDSSVIASSGRCNSTCGQIGSTTCTMCLELDSTLREQGVTEPTEKTLRRKMFSSDGSVDISDLVQLNFIYVQVT